MEKCLVNNQTASDKKIIEDCLKGCEHDGSYIPVSEVKRIMQKALKLKELECRKYEYTDGDLILAYAKAKQDVLRQVEEKIINVKLTHDEMFGEDIRVNAIINTIKQSLKEIK